MILHPDHQAERDNLFWARQEKLLEIAEELNLDWDDLSQYEMKCLNDELNERLACMYEQ